MAKESKRVYHASMIDVPKTLTVRYGRTGNPHLVDEHHIDLDNAAWVEVLAIRTEKPPRPLGGWRLEE